MKNEELWNGPVHRAFITSLGDDQLRALWELLIVATFADDELTLAERHDVAAALRDAPGFAEAISLRGDSADVDRIADAYRADGMAFVEDLAARLGDDAARRGAFRTAVQLLKLEGLADIEAEFVREIGHRLGLEPEVVEFAIDL